MSFHDLEDNAKGFLQGAQINIGSMQIRAGENESISLYKLDIIDIFSLAPRSDFFKPVAWRIYTGFERQLQMLHISPTKVAEGTISSIVTIFAPISGSITKVNVTKGSYVSPATSILEIIDNEHVHLELSVFEKDIMAVKKGQEIDFKIPEASEEIFKANVYLVGAVMEENRTIKVHGHLKDESKNNFLTGMFVTADIITSSKSENAIPSQAVVFIEEVPYVLVLEKKEGDTLHLWCKQRAHIFIEIDQYQDVIKAAFVDQEVAFEVDRWRASWKGAERGEKESLLIRLSEDEFAVFGGVAEGDGAVLLEYLFAVAGSAPSSTKRMICAKRSLGVAKVRAALTRRVIKKRLRATWVLISLRI